MAYSINQFNRKTQDAIAAEIDKQGVKKPLLCDEQKKAKTYIQIQKIKALCELWFVAGMPKPVYEHKFCDARKWRFDFAWPEKKVALEVEGGIWTGGRHTRGAGFLKDMEKYNAAAIDGWRVFRCVPDTLMSVKTTAMLAEALR